MMSDEEISFFAKYGDWVVIKKRNLEGVEKKEVVAILSSIADTTVRKSFDFSGIRKEVIDSYVGKITKGKRKGIGTLASVLSEIKPAELKEILSSACPDEKLVPLAEAYFFNSLLSSLGYSAMITPTILANVYPELKLPKPRGRTPKK